MEANQITALRSIIHRHLNQQHVYGAVRSFVRDFIAEHQGTSGPVEEDKLFAALQEKKVIEEVIASLGGLNVPPAGTKPITTSILKSGSRYLHLRILKVKALLPMTIESESGISISVLLNGQRHRTKQVAAGLDVKVEEAFLFELPPARDIAELIKKSGNCMLHLVVIRHDIDGTTEHIGSHRLDWRKIVLSGVAALSVELASTDGETVSSGIIDLNLEMIPRPGKTSDIDEATLHQQLKQEKDIQAEADRRFFSYAKAWWKEYTQLRPEHVNRKISLFAKTEFGLNRPVTSFVQRMEGGRLLRSAGEAARFVSLLKHQQDNMTLPHKNDVWLDTHTFLAKGCGEVEDHAILLCSLLLGFDLDAYVVTGTTSFGAAHMWVMTIATSDDASSRLPTVTFWEPQTASRYVHPQSSKARVSHKYGHVYGVFNDRSLYANMQPSDDVVDCTFDLWNSARWKAMNDAILTAIPKQQAVSLLPSCVNPLNAEETLELKLTALIAAHRRSMGLTFEWDSHLSYLLSPALVSYETERVTGLSHGNTEFQQSIKRAIPELHVFKAFPISFSHLDAPKMFEALLASSAAVDILSIAGGADLARFGLRCHVFAYPESAVVVWVMLAVIYPSTD